jgi:hypothetical protein
MPAYLSRRRFLTGIARGAASLTALNRLACSAATDDRGAMQIRPWTENPFYWQYRGEPVLLLGGSWQDNLFNHPTGLAEHLDLLVASGGNYVRNTMSHRNVGNVFAYELVDGKFDLDRWNEEYWQRLDDFLRMTYERDIIVQIEVFDPWDHFIDHQSLGGWSKHPFNPINNVNYTAEQSGLPTAIDYSPSPRPSTHAVWLTVPALQNNGLILGYQQAYIDKMLSISLQYPHVLYCIQNESGEELAFGEYWADHIHRRARQADRTVFVTDMRRNNDITAADHASIYARPDRYSFVDISQNNSQNIPTGQLHWDRIQAVRAILRERGVRPMNNIKIYSREHGEHVDAPQRFWRVILGGCASARFHRPHPLEDSPGDHDRRSYHGLGLHAQAQTHIRSLRMFTGAVDWFSGEPRNDLLGDRSENEAYCAANPGRHYAVYFPDSGQVTLDVSAARGSLQVRWLDIAASEWQDEQTVGGGGTIELKAPRPGQWAVLVTAQQ